jgi:hypothetical protein
MPNAILAYINADVGPSPVYTWIAVRYTTPNSAITSCTKSNTQLESSSLHHGQRRR